MNKHERATIKKIILEQIELLSQDILDIAATVRLERLNAVLQRIDADNFGECFKCDVRMPLEKLHAFPESTLCADCLEGSDG